MTKEIKDIVRIPVKYGEKASGSFSKPANETTHIKLVCEWTSTPNFSNKTSTVTATVSVFCNMRGRCLNNSWVKVDGNVKYFSGKSVQNASGTGAHKNILCEHTITVYHNENGSKSVPFEFSWEWNGYVWHNNYSGNISTVYGYGTATLDAISINPGSPVLELPSNSNFVMQESGSSWIVYSINGLFEFWCGGGTNVEKRIIGLQYYTGTEWQNWTPNNGFNEWKTINEASRAALYMSDYNSRGFSYRAYSGIMSPTGSVVETGWTYFRVNDIPRFEGLRSDTDATSGNFTIQHNGMIDQFNTDVATKYYKKNSAGEWQYIAIGGNSYEFAIAPYAEIGERVEFGAQAVDNFEDGVVVGGVFVTRTYGDPELNIRSANPNSATASDGKIVYAGDNQITFEVANGSQYHEKIIKMEWFNGETQTWHKYNPLGFNQWKTSNTATYDFPTSANDRGVLWSVVCDVRTIDGKISGGKWKYFWINDIPKLTGFRSDKSETQNTFTLSHSGIVDSFNDAVHTKYYYKSNSQWVYIADGVNSHSLNIQNYAQPGISVEFGARACDDIENGEIVGGVFVKRLEVYGQSNVVISPAKTNTTTYQGNTVYMGDNSVNFSIYNGESLYRTMLTMEFSDPLNGDNSWETVATFGFNNWTSNARANYNFTSLDRKKKWRIKADSKSQSNNITEGSWQYFWINDLPSISRLNTDKTETQNTFTLSHSGIVDTMSKTPSSKYYYKRNNQWALIGDGGNSYPLNIQNYAQSGERVEFGVKPNDGLEEGSIVGGTFVRRLEIYDQSNVIITPTITATSMFEGKTVYAGDNLIRFAVANGSSFYRTMLTLEYSDKLGGSSSWSRVNDSGFNSWATNASTSRTFGYSDRGKYWRVRGDSKSQSNNVTTGEWVYFWINDKPRISTITADESLVNDSVNLRWAGLSDKIATGVESYEFAKKVGSSYVKIAEASNTTNKNINISANASRGETINIYIRGKDSIEIGDWSSSYARVTRNNTPYFSSGSRIIADEESSPYNGTFTDTITLNFPIIRDNESTVGAKYVLEYAVSSKGGSFGSWALQQETVSTTVTVRASNLVSDGGKIKFRLKAKDSLGLFSSYIESSELTKAGSPNMPTNVRITGNRVGNRFSYISRVDWDRVMGDNGYYCKYYDCELQALSSNGTVVDTMHYRVSSNSFVPDLNRIGRGEKFRLRIRGVDTFNNPSDYYVSDAFVRNRLPNTPTNFVNDQKVTTSSTVTVVSTWDTATDPDGGAVRYSLRYVNKTSGDQTVYSSGTINSATKQIPASSGDVIAVFLESIDDLGERSREVSSGDMSANTPPEAPIVAFPKNTTVTSYNPRLCVTLGNDVDNDYMSLEITVNGATYSSLLYTSYFNKERFISGEKTAIKLPQLREGNNTIRLRSHDGWAYSPYVDFTLTYSSVSYDLEYGANPYITSADFNSMLKDMNTCRRAYGKSEASVGNVSSRSSFVRASDFSSLYDNIKDVTNTINQTYPGFLVTSTRPAFSNQIITKEMALEIVKLIKNP